jgi:hypothetical protein
LIRIFVDFPNAPAGSTDTVKALHDHFMPGASNWYNTSSYGRLQLEVITDNKFYRMSANSNTYGWTRSLTSALQRKYISDATKAAGKAPGKMDVLYIVPNKGAKDIWFSPTYMGPSTFPDGTVAPKTVTFGMDMYSWVRKKIIIKWRMC